MSTFRSRRAARTYTSGTSRRTQATAPRKHPIPAERAAIEANRFVQRFFRSRASVVTPDHPFWHVATGAVEAAIRSDPHLRQTHADDIIAAAIRSYRSPDSGGSDRVMRSIFHKRDDDD